MARVKFKPGELPDINTTSAFNRPTMVKLIGECVAVWPELENELALLYAWLSPSDIQSSVAKYFAAPQGDARRALINAAASSKCDEKNQALVAVVLNVMRKLEAELRDVVRGRWGYLESIADGLLWVDPTTYSQATGAGIKTPKTPTPSSIDLSEHLYLYKEADLEELRQALISAQDLAFALLAHFNNGHQFYIQAILNHPLVDKALEKEFKRRGWPISG